MVINSKLKTIAKRTVLIFLGIVFSLNAFGAKSDLRAMLSFITTVKTQIDRNTCTVFATNAVLESLYIREGGSIHFDLSEEWLQYLAALTNASGGAKGSMVSTNLRNAARWGVPQEATMPFTSGEWKGDEPEALDMCGHGSDYPKKLTYTRCLFGKRPAHYLNMSNSDLSQSPGGQEFLDARTEAQKFLAFTKGLRTSVIQQQAIKQYLDQNYPLALEINIFYGSWNLNSAPDKGMIQDKEKLSRGEVNYPEIGSIDRIVSQQKIGRHAVQIVGYDDDITLTYKKNMADGSTKEFTRKGVYIFKNSWGTKNFGNQFRYDGMRIPGFGMISQDHVHEFGKVTVIK